MASNICPDRSCIGRGLAAIRGLGGIDSFFLLYLIRAFENDLSGKGTGTTFKAITGKHLNNFPVPLPPLPEQQRIVSKIDELFTKLDAGVDALKMAKVLLNRYRQAVLKSAFEGKLTEEWREENSDDPTLGQDQLEDVKNSKHNFYNIYKPKKQKKIPSFNHFRLPKLPVGWCWTRLDDLFHINYGLGERLSKTKLDHKDDVPVIRIPNVKPLGGLDLSDLKYFPLEKTRLEKLKLHKQDVLFNWRNAPKWIGRSATFNQSGSYVNASFLLRLRPFQKGYSDFVSFCLNYLRISGYFMTKVEHAVNQANFNATKTRQIEIPFPPLAEQDEIIRLVDESLTIADKVEEDLVQQMDYSEKLRVSVLRKAFQGQLVPQDPTEEPASKLLERIKAEKEVAQQKVKKKTTKKKRTTVKTRKKQRK